MLLGVIGLLVGPADPASAHAALVGSSPAADSIVQNAPTQVVLTFTETVNPVPGRIRVIAPDGNRIDRDEARSSGLQLIIPLRSDQAVGTYLVTFRAISADSHPIGGAFSYSYKELSPGGPPSANGADSQASILVLSALPVARWIGYVGLLLLVGSVLVLALLWPQRLSRVGPTRVVWIGAGLVALGTILELGLQVPYVAGSLGNVTGADVREVLASQYGAAHLIRLGVLGAALVLVRPILQGKGWGADRVLLAVLGTIAVATWSVSGHPSASPTPTLTVVSDMIHIASMSVWLGGLVMLIVFLLPRANAVELGAIVPVWSRWATYAVGALIVTGVAQALIEVNPLSTLFTTSYGWLVVAKATLAGLVLLVAAVSHRMVGVVADHTDGSAGRLRRVVIVEAAIAAVILGVSSVLVQVTPARTSVDSASAYAAVQTEILRDPRFILTVDLTPGTVGVNQIHMYATTPDGQPANILKWTVKAANPDQGIEPIEATVLKISPDHATGQVGLPVAGDWKFTFELLLTEDTNGIVAATFTVKA
jgi:copper transport protein